MEILESKLKIINRDMEKGLDNLVLLKLREKKKSAWDLE